MYYDNTNACVVIFLSPDLFPRIVKVFPMLYVLYRRVSAGRAATSLSHFFGGVGCVNEWAPRGGSLNIHEVSFTLE